MATTESAPSRFRGLNNRRDPTALGMQWLTIADHAACDDAGVLSSVPTSRAVAQHVVDAYATYDGRLFVIDEAGVLSEMTPDGTRRLRATGLTGVPFAWAEQGSALFLMSAAQAWVVYPNGAVRWGYFCPSPGTVPDYPVSPRRAYPPPSTVGPIAPWRTRMIVAVYEAAQDRTVLYKSREGLPHEFYLDSDFVLVPGRVRLLASTAKGLVVGTDTAIYLDAEDAPMVRAATYGVPKSVGIHHDDDRVYFWSDRGLCAAFPFENLTDAAWIAPRHARAATAALHWKGSRYAAVALSGPTDYDSTQRPFVPEIPILADYPSSI